MGSEQEGVLRVDQVLADHPCHLPNVTTICRLGLVADMDV